MSVDDQIRLLVEMLERAKALSASGDPLMSSQYQLLHGRITALLAQLAITESEITRG